MFKGVAIVVSATFQRMVVHKIIGETDIEIVELGCLYDFAFDFLAKGWNFIANQRVIKDLKIRLDRLGGDATVGPLFFIQPWLWAFVKRVLQGGCRRNR